MYPFIENNFHPQHKFFERAAKSGTIKWQLSTDKIISVSGIIEIPGIDKNKLVEFTNSEQLINEIVPAKIYQKQKEKIKEFFNTRNNHGIKYIVNFVIDYKEFQDFSDYKSFVYVYLDYKKDIGKFTTTRANSSDELNGNILIISKLTGENEEEVVYAASINNGYGISLVGKEFNILRLIAEGYASDGISNLLFISKHTVDDYRKSLLEKFKAKNAFQLIYHAHKEGFI